MPASIAERPKKSRTTSSGPSLLVRDPTARCSAVHCQSSHHAAGLLLLDQRLDLIFTVDRLQVGFAFSSANDAGANAPQ
jgi:hypothetical protein